MIIAYLTALDPTAYRVFYQYNVPNGTGSALPRQGQNVGRKIM